MASEILQIVSDIEKGDFQGDTTRTLNKTAKSMSTILLSFPNVPPILWFLIPSVSKKSSTS